MNEDEKKRDTILKRLLETKPEQNKSRKLKKKSKKAAKKHQKRRPI